MFKKLFLPVLIFTIMLISATPTYATESNTTNNKSTVTYEANEITDLDEIISRAEQGITDLQFPQDICKITLDNGVEKEIPALKTTQLLKTTKYKDGTVKKAYATNSILRSSTPQYGENYAQGFTAYSTLYFSTVTNGGITYYDMESVSGGWVVPSSGSISKRKVTVSNNGYVLGGGVCTKSAVYNPTSNSWNYSYSSSWPIVAANAQLTPGATTEATITNGGTTSRLQLVNNVPATI